MTSGATKRGNEELYALRRQSRGLYWAVAFFSFFVNLLMLTGPLYMLQVYDRVLVSGSVETLVSLSLIVVFLYGLMGVFDVVRVRISARIAARFQIAAQHRVFDAALRQRRHQPDAPPTRALANLDIIKRCIASPILMAVFDLPWAPIFFAAIFIFHPVLGFLSIAGALALIAITVVNQILSHRSQIASDQAEAQSDRIATQILEEAEAVQALSMQQNAFDQWQSVRQISTDSSLRAIDITGGFSVLTKTLRLLLQSAMLGVGAGLVLSGQMTAGGMIAGTILLARALSPIETLLNQWPLAQRGRHAWVALAELLGRVSLPCKKTVLPKPLAHLQMDNAIVAPPGERKVVLRGVSFKLEPGEAMGVIGPSGSGKSTLARVLTGAWPLAGGALRIDGVSLDQYDATVVGRYVGYLPQRVRLFDGTVAQNIARLAANPVDEAVIEAARTADAHDMILKLPNGYNTRIQANSTLLSGGQLQRIGLARAVYGDPVIVVLDEPNSSLDAEGSVALNRAIRTLKATGKSVLIMAHRPAAIQECDILLVLDAGRQTAFGPKKEIMAQMLKNAEALNVTSMQAAGVA
jgi:PrtD family type I secretion system ABC transporter